ncbi:hypothetical protein OG738_21225 [Amycolatopsis sp. NBC_01488]|uniref:hypothetical protein n=1 Tax=Amycolatopsis sp. NBC_01488 TaxID=2903563 RepID=UPI002E2CAB7D|nr:hypothetical protein [Amycolatopsis sp. NBC_01488]
MKTALAAAATLGTTLHTTRLAKSLIPTAAVALGATLHTTHPAKSPASATDTSTLPEEPRELT